MKRNIEPRHPRIDRVWDLSEKEVAKFYKGCGRATVVIDEQYNIIECIYTAISNDDASLFDDRTPTTYSADVVPLTNKEILSGMMSCGQFMTERDESA